MKEGGSLTITSSFYQVSGYNLVAYTIATFQAASDKLCKQLEAQLTEMNIKLEDTQKQINEMNGQKNRMNAENSELIRQLEEAESQVNQLNKVKQNLTKQMEETRGNLEEETRSRAKSQGEIRNLQAELEQVRDLLEEEQESKADLRRALTKANNDSNSWRQKFESGEGGIRSEELDELKRKMTAKLQEAEGQVEAAQGKCNNLEKAKNRLQGELEDVMCEVERVSVLQNIT